MREDSGEVASFVSRDPLYTFYQRMNPHVLNVKDVEGVSSAALGISLKITITQIRY
jgi:hypothetical protein